LCPGLTREDFIVYEENQLQEVTHFSNERVPVSLGIVLDTSGSMVGEKLASALDAVDRFLTKLLSPDDEIFLYTFNNQPNLLQDWTKDRQRLSRSIRRINASGGTAMLDALAEAVPLAQTGETSQARRRSHLRWQRHRQPDVSVGSETDDSRIGSDGVCDRDRRTGGDDVQLAHASSTDALPTVSRPVSWATAARTRRRHAAAPAAVPVAVSGSAERNRHTSRGRRARERECPPRDHR
jgi:VWFA-related protein